MIIITIAGYEQGAVVESLVGDQRSTASRSKEGVSCRLFPRDRMAVVQAVRPGGERQSPRDVVILLERASKMDELSAYSWILVGNQFFTPTFLQFTDRLNAGKYYLELLPVVGRLKAPGEMRLDAYGYGETHEAWNDTPERRTAAVKKVRDWCLKESHYQSQRVRALPNGSSSSSPKKSK